MATGMAIPHYLKLIGIAGKDSAEKTNRKHLIEAYGYIAAYKANTEKDFAGSIGYFEKMLALDPGNTDARKYIRILQKNQIKAEAGLKGEAADGKYPYSFANRTARVVTPQIQRAGFFSPGTTIWKGPLLAGNGLPSTRSARMITRSVNAVSNSGRENTTS